MPVHGMPVRWWDGRTLTEDAVAFDSPGRVEWIRYRLADEINRRYWRSQGIRVMWVSFESLDGDQYSHPVVRTDCRLGAASYGRLSGHRIALDALPFGDEFGWAGLVPEGELDHAGVVYPTWQDYLHAAERAMGLDQLDAAGHDECTHVTAEDNYGDLWLTALLVRTRLGYAADASTASHRWMAERTLDAIHGISAVRSALIAADPANFNLANEAVRAVAIVESFEDGRTLMVRQDGIALTPTGPIDLRSDDDVFGDPGTGLLARADRLQRALLNPPVVSGAGADLHAPAGGLPLNRKERFYTGTVLPAIICADDFRHLGRFTQLAGIGDITVTADPAEADFQLFTEYSLGESVMTAEDKARFGTLSTREAPDLVMWCPRAEVLLVVEAKMFHRPSPDQIRAQLDAQGEVAARMLAGLGHDSATVRQVFLVAARYLDAVAAGLPPHVVPMTWESVHQRYRDVASPYWLAVLRSAIMQWSDLRSTAWESGTPYDDKLAGNVIAYKAAAGDLDGWYIGRQGGLPAAIHDIDCGHWHKRPYPIRRQPIDKKNWFPLADLLPLLTTTVTDDEDSTEVKGAAPPRSYAARAHPAGSDHAPHQATAGDESS